MKKVLYLIMALGAVSCTTENNVKDTLYNVMESGANMAVDSLHRVANKELERRTGIDSLASKIGAADTINVEREVKRELIKVLSE